MPQFFVQVFFETRLNRGPANYSLMPSPVFFLQVCSCVETRLNRGGAASTGGLWPPPPVLEPSLCCHTDSSWPSCSPPLPTATRPTFHTYLPPPHPLFLLSRDINQAVLQVQVQVQVEVEVKVDLPNPHLSILNGLSFSLSVDINHPCPSGPSC